MSNPNTVIRTPLQLFTLGLLVALTETSPVALAIAQRRADDIQNLTEEEVNFAREMSSALSCTVNTCHFGISPAGRLSIFAEYDDLKNYLDTVKNARPATKDEALKDAFTKAANIEYYF